MKKLTAQGTLKYIIKLLIYYLEELNEIQDLESEQFRYGEKTAYAECLEIIQYWEYAAANGLDFDIENRFPI